LPASSPNPAAALFLVDDIQDAYHSPAFLASLAPRIRQYINSGALAFSDDICSFVEIVD
jgi:hypothetical protein